MKERCQRWTVDSPADVNVDALARRPGAASATVRRRARGKNSGTHVITVHFKSVTWPRCRGVRRASACTCRNVDVICGVRSRGTSVRRTAAVARARGLASRARVATSRIPRRRSNCVTSGWRVRVGLGVSHILFDLK